MSDYTIAAYNVRFMNSLFQDNAVKPGETDRAANIAAVIDRVDPHVLAISEAANDDDEHQHFIDEYLGGRFAVVSGASRGRQNLVFYIRAPFELVEVDGDSDFYEPWTIDIDQDTVTERFRWERRPLEAVFRIGAGSDVRRIRFINVHTKSKGIFDVVDLARFNAVSLGNRKKLIAQATRLRQRLDDLLAEDEALPTVALGDMNDGPGLDAHEQRLGRSFVETLMGSVFRPGNIFRNALIHIPDGDRWTADFPDPIVSHPFGYDHRVWIDHILVSPDLADPASPLRWVPDSGRIDAHDGTARDASDHSAVSCVLTDDD